MTQPSSPYFCPLPNVDRPAPDNALPLAGGWCWFTHVQVLERGRRPQVVPADALPADWRLALCAPRAAVAGVAMDRPRLMGILNVTPDSFSDGGRFTDRAAAQAQARRMADAGADFIDIGGESTRPGAAEVPADQEIARTEPVVAALADCGVPISIDTRKAAVARAALAAGAAMVNDVTALGFDAGMAPLVAASDAPVCLMHSRGDPATMQRDPRYDDVLLDVFDHLRDRIALAEAAGIARARIVVDPGIGFGKTLDHNLALLRGLALFHGLGCPVLLGASRKRFIGTLGDEPEADRRLPGSLAVALAGVAKGVQITRIHDVRETRQGLVLWQAATGMGQMGQG